MSHQEKQSIFDEYARTREFEDWNDLKNCCIEFDIDLDEYIFAACDKVQEEQQKRIADKATTKTVFTAYGSQQAVEKASIINPENKIQ